MPNCCICGRPLPNRYAIAGTCEEDGCDAAFCALHWNNGNRKCGQHGWKPSGLLAGNEVRSPEVGKEGKKVIEGEASAVPGDVVSGEREIREKAKRFLTAEQAKGIVRSVAEFAGKMGRAASSLVMKIKNANSPETLLTSIDASLEANRTQRAPLMARADALFAEIAAKKKVYQSAPPARKKLLELELKSLLSEYKGIERQMTAFFENENTLNTVRGRILELMALGMRKIDERTIDRLTDDIEEAVGEQEDVAGAVRDLDKAGKRRESESDQESFESALADFDDAGADPVAADGISAGAAPAADPFAIDPPVHSAPAAPSTPVPDEP